MSLRVGHRRRARRRGGGVRVGVFPSGTRRSGPPCPSLPVLLLALAGLVTLGCATEPLASGRGDEARFRHRELGYTIAYPGVLERPGWRTHRLEESDLLVRHSDGSAWALSSQCRATGARPELLARELARVTGGRPAEPGRAIRHAGLAGWVQRLIGREGERILEIKTVTLRGPRCTYDWILLAPSPERFAGLEPSFDAWWQSFEPGPGDRVEEGGP